MFCNAAHRAPADCAALPTADCGSIEQHVGSKDETPIDYTIVDGRYCAVRLLCAVVVCCVAMYVCCASCYWRCYVRLLRVVVVVCVASFDLCVCCDVRCYLRSLAYRIRMLVV